MKKIFTLLFAVVASVGTMFAGESVMIDGFAFRFNQTSLTAELVRSGNPYSGDIVIPESVVYNEITYPVGSIEESAFYGYTEITSVSIPNSVTYISSTAFYGCTGLTSVTIPDSLKEIRGSALGACTGLTSINVSADNNYYCSVDGILFNKNKTILVIYPGGKQGAYTIPNGVTNIGRSAFDGAILTSVTIPNGVIHINASAFYKCAGLTSVVIPNSVLDIDDHAFCQCSGLTSVTIGNSVASIGRYAFYECTGLTSITCEAVNPPTLEREAFSKVDKSIPLYVPEESIEVYQAANQWKDFMNIQAIGEGIDQISQESRAKSQKLMKDGQILILRGEKTYSITGQKL